MTCYIMSAILYSIIPLIQLNTHTVSLTHVKWDWFFSLKPSIQIVEAVINSTQSMLNFIKLNLVINLVITVRFVVALQTKQV